MSIVARGLGRGAQPGAIVASGLVRESLVAVEQPAAGGVRNLSRGVRRRRLWPPFELPPAAPVPSVPLLPPASPLRSPLPPLTYADDEHADAATRRKRRRRQLATLVAIGVLRR